MSPKYCFVPGCKNSSTSTPDKVFFSVPRGEVRKKWCKMVRRGCTSLQSSLQCCADHFNVEEDVDNWIQNKIMVQNGLKPFPFILKKGIMPHIFDCQEDRKRSHSTPKRSAFEKRKRLSILQGITNNIDLGNVPSKSLSSNHPPQIHEQSSMFDSGLPDYAPFAHDLSVNYISVPVEVLIEPGFINDMSEFENIQMATEPEPTITDVPALACTPITTVSELTDNYDPPVSLCTSVTMDVKPVGTYFHFCDCQAVKKKKFEEAQTQTYIPHRAKYTQTKNVTTKEVGSQSSRAKVFPHELRERDPSYAES